MSAYYKHVKNHKMDSRVQSQDDASNDTLDAAVSITEDAVATIQQ